MLISTLSVAWEMTPGDCCISSSWFRKTNCHLCPYGHADTLGETSLCGAATTGLLVVSFGIGDRWGRCKNAPNGKGKLKEGSCCVASGFLSWLDVSPCEECKYGYTNGLVDTSKGCSAINAASLAIFTTMGTCNYKPPEDAINDAFLTSRLMQMATAKRHFYANHIPHGIDHSDQKQFMDDHDALRAFGYNLEDNKLASDSFHVIQGGRTHFGSLGAHIIYFFAEHGGNTELVIAFPGSATKNDWLYTNAKLAGFGAGDTKCLQAEGEEFCGASSVVEHYESTRTQFLQEIEELLNKQCVESCVDVIRVLGHSLGGSAAQFGAIDMAMKFAGRFNVWLSTYASVRALTPKSSDKAHSLLTSNGNRAMRFMLAGDIVPWTGKGLKHVGKAYLMNNGALFSQSRNYMPMDSEAFLCCGACKTTDNVATALLTPVTSAKCLLNYHVMSQYIDHINLIKSSHRYLLDNGRVRSRKVTRSCSAFPPNCPTYGQAYIGCFVDDASRDLGVNMGRGHWTAETCGQACQEYNYFAYQNGANPNGSACFCGNDYATQAQYVQVSDSECEVDGEMRGGIWRNAIYRNPAKQELQCFN